MTVQPFNSQVIGQAHYAARALLQRELAGTGIGFEQNLALNATAAAGGTIDRAALVARLTGSLKIDTGAAEAALAGLADAGLLAPAGPAGLALTHEGAALQARTAEAAAAIAGRLYAGIPPEDAAVAGRLLTLIAERANAELAGA
ncbi:hypothetical protein ACGFX4_24630 [Kitasatospora sp. NPDC048365]|uniref:hypothetical protein n=1 Tax=Kitasatospora sp. NPDC048365 TaxID=3364050 RepID=UPI00371DE86B